MRLLILITSLLVLSPPLSAEKSLYDLSGDRDYQESISSHKVTPTSPTLVYLDQHTIAISFSTGFQLYAPVAKEYDGPISTVYNREKPIPFLFVVIIVDAMTGSQLNKLSWPTVFSDSRVLRSGDGGLIVLVGDKLYRYSKALEKEVEVTVPAEFSPLRNAWAFDERQIDIAPDHKELVLAIKHGDRTRIEWRRVSDLAITSKSESDFHSERELSAGNGFVLWTGVVENGISGLLILEHNETVWKLFCKACDQSTGYFLDSDHIMIEAISFNPDKKLRILDRSGAEVNSMNPRNNFAFAGRSERGRKFAMKRGELHLGRGTDSGSTATVELKIYDWTTLKEIKTLRFDIEPIRTRNMESFPTLAVAFSPSADEIAVLAGPRLTVHTLR